MMEWVDIALIFVFWGLELFWLPTIQIWEVVQADPIDRPQNPGMYIMLRVLWQGAYLLFGGLALIRFSIKIFVLFVLFMAAVGAINWAL